MIASAVRSMVMINNLGCYFQARKRIIRANAPNQTRQPFPLSSKNRCELIFINVVPVDATLFAPRSAIPSYWCERFAATRSWRFRRRKLSATTELDMKHKVIFYNRTANFL
jgi:hypothetical protein